MCIVPAVAGPQMCPKLEGHAPLEDVAPNHNKPTDHHQKESLIIFGLYHFLEVLCSMYRLLRVRRVG